MLLLCRGLQHSGVCQNDCRILVTIRHFIYHDAVEHTCLHIFLLDIEVAIRYSVIENAFWNLQFRALLPHGKEQLGKLLCGVWSY